MKLIDARKKVLGWNKPPMAGMLTPAISYRKPTKCIGFYRGNQIPDNILDWIVELATYGYITEAGRNLYLIPTGLYKKATLEAQAKADEYARRRRKTDPGFKSGPASPSIKKGDCVPLTSFLPKKVAGNKVRHCENRVLSPLIPRPSEGASRNARTLGHVDVKRNATCLHCDEIFEPKRSDAKHCSKACKQAAYRSRAKA